MARRLTTISIALVLALLGTMLVVVYVGRADARAAEGMETISVLVAKGPLAKGQTVGDAQAADLIGSELLPKKAVPAGVLTELTPADAPLVFASDVTQGEMIQRPRLVPAASVVEGLAIPDGKLAVSVQLDDPARVATFLEVGSEIAIFDSFTAIEGNEGTGRTPTGTGLEAEKPDNKATRLLLPRVKVLAVGSTTSAERPKDEPDDGPSAAQAAPASTVTLVTVAVDQAEAEKLIHGIQTGSLYMGLLGTYEVKPGPGIDNRNLFRSDGQV
jgi:pilus assembly protein CpaB